MDSALKLRAGEGLPHSGTAPVRLGLSSDHADVRLALKNRGLEVRVTRTRGGMDALAPAWKALEARAASPMFFQSQAWCRHVSSTLDGDTSPGCEQPFVMSIWRGHDLVAVWPLKLTRESGARVLTDLTAPFGQYADIIITNDAGIEPENLCRWLIARARDMSGADALVLRKVRADTPLGRILAQDARALDAARRAPFVSMAGFASFEAFHASTKAKTRKNVRNATHRLEKIGAVTHKVERRSARMDAALEHCFDLRSTWLAEHGQVSTAFAHPAFGDLVRGLADPASHEIDVLSMMLMLDDRPISIHYGFLHNRRYYAFMAARDPEFDVCSPGKVHLEHVLAACFAQGAETVDLLAPDMPYKHVWATDSVAMDDYGLTWSVRGWLAIDVWRRLLRPRARRAFLAMPDALRKQIASRMRATRP